MNYLIEASVRRPDARASRGAVLVELVSFLAIGTGAALSFVLISSLLVSLVTDMPPFLVNTLCYAGFIVPVYLMHRRYSFRSRAAHKKALPRYVGVQVLGLGPAALFSYLAYALIGLPAPLAAAVVIGLTSGVNFIALRGWAFARTPLW